jgi:hypothetical protein
VKPDKFGNSKEVSRLMKRNTFPEVYIRDNFSLIFNINILKNKPDYALLMGLLIVLLILNPPFYCGFCCNLLYSCCFKMS